MRFSLSGDYIAIRMGRSAIHMGRKPLCAARRLIRLGKSPFDKPKRVIRPERPLFDTVGAPIDSESSPLGCSPHVLSIKASQAINYACAIPSFLPVYMRSRPRNSA